MSANGDVDPPVDPVNGQEQEEEVKAEEEERDTKKEEEEERDDTEDEEDEDDDDDEEDEEDEKDEDEESTDESVSSMARDLAGRSPSDSAVALLELFTDPAKIRKMNLDGLEPLRRTLTIVSKKEALPARRKLVNEVMAHLIQFLTDNDFEGVEGLRVCIVLAGDTSAGKDKLTAMIVGANIANSDSSISTCAAELIRVLPDAELEEGEIEASVEGYGVSLKRVSLEEAMTERKKIHSRLQEKNDLFGRHINITLHRGGDDVEPISVLNNPGLVNCDTEEHGPRLRKMLNHSLQLLSDQGNGVLVMVKKFDQPVENAMWRSLDVLRKPSVAGSSLPVLLASTAADCMEPSIKTSTYRYRDFAAKLLDDTLVKLPSGVQGYATSAWPGDTDDDYDRRHEAEQALEGHLDRIDAIIRRKNPEYFASDVGKAERKQLRDRVGTGKFLDHVYSLAAAQSVQPMALLVRTLGVGLDTLAADQRQKVNAVRGSGESHLGAVLIKACADMALCLRVYATFSSPPEQIQQFLRGRDVGRTALEEYLDVKRKHSHDSDRQKLSLPPPELRRRNFTDMPAKLQKMNGDDVFLMSINNFDELNEVQLKQMESKLSAGMDDVGGGDEPVMPKKKAKKRKAVSVRHTPSDQESVDSTGRNNAKALALNITLDRLLANVTLMADLFEIPEKNVGQLEVGASVQKMSGVVSRMDSIMSDIADHLRRSLESIMAFVNLTVTEQVSTIVALALETVFECYSLKGMKDNVKVRRALQSTFKRLFEEELSKWLDHAASVFLTKTKKMPMEQLLGFLVDSRNFRKQKGMSIKEAETLLRKLRQVASKPCLSEADARWIHSVKDFYSRCELKAKVRAMFTTVVMETLTQFGLLGDHGDGDAGLGAVLFKQVCIQVLGSSAIQEAVVKKSSLYKDAKRVLCDAFRQMVQKRRVSAGAEVGAGEAAGGKNEEEEEGENEWGVQEGERLTDREQEELDKLLRTFLVHAKGAGSAGHFNHEALGHVYLQPPLATEKKETQRSGLQGLVPEWSEKEVLFHKWVHLPLTRETENLCVSLLDEKLDDGEQWRRQALRDLQANYKAAAPIYKLLCAVKAAHSKFPIEDGIYDLVAKATTACREINGARNHYVKEINELPEDTEETEEKEEELFADVQDESDRYEDEDGDEDQDDDEDHDSDDASESKPSPKARKKKKKGKQRR